MKFVCMKCEKFMLFQKLERPADDSLGVMFECPECASRFSMVTNSGETSLVQALGVKIGGRTTAPEPFELTRETLKEPALQSQAPSESPSESSSTSTSSTTTDGSCPFSSMLSDMDKGKTTQAKWTPEALVRLDKIPEMIRPMIKAGIEAYALQNAYQVITPAILEESKEKMGEKFGSSMGT